MVGAIATLQGVVCQLVAMFVTREEATSSASSKPFIRITQLVAADFSVLERNGVKCVVIALLRAAYGGSQTC